MKKFLLYIFCIICMTVFSIDVFALEESEKLIINSVNVKKDSFSVYFDTVYTNGSFNSSNIDSSNLTASIGSVKLPLKSLDRYESTGEGIAYVLMADASKSMGTKGKESIIKLFTEIINQASINDKIAVVTFGESENILQDFTSDKKILIDKINTVNVKEDGTDLYRAVSKALDMLSSDKSLPAEKAIVILSDGQESNDQGITKDEVLLKLPQSHIPVVSVPYKTSDSAAAKENLKILGSFARLSNGLDFTQNDNKTFSDIAKATAERFKKTFVGKFDSSAVKMEGQTVTLNLAVKLNGSTTISANQSIVLPVVDTSQTTKITPTPPQTQTSVVPGKNTKGFSKYIPYIAGGAIILLTVLVLLVTKMRKKDEYTEYSFNEGGSTGEEEKNSTVFVSEGDENKAMEVGKTVGLYEESNGSNSIQKTGPLPQSPPKGGIKIRFTKLGREDIVSYEILLSSSIIIGRDPAIAKLVFKEDELLSGKHCELVLQDSRIFVRDLGSTNGTYVNGVPLSGPCCLHNDDILLIGSMELRVCFYEPN
ncbi:FHA domain-containing protein [Clostridium fungisolvens]|uniref:FHA domain-containing protein n=1 Tax=Clostridium fungisolvens TaxID=1604897 RepID=A0A6V8SE28_9CLOT|nr:FHA domain-containing protein [Clostridium fungisolvens]GFP75489.1 hypothetical protein bsdtw1_01569 [Clostridium fungisolvens]